MRKPTSPTSCPAEVILINAEVLSCVPGQEADREIAISGGRILRLGHDLSKDRDLASGARIVDCGGGAVLPGFVDAHLHFFSFVDTMLSLDLRARTGIRSIARIQALLKREAKATPPGEWLKGKGYNEFYLEEKRHPTRWELDAAAPHHPVKLTHRSRHAHVLNSLALRLVGIDRHTPDPPGGMIQRDLASGDPTGLLFEMGDVLAQRVPRWAAGKFERAVGRAAQELASVGITAFVDASPTNDTSRRQLFLKYKEKGLIPQRVVMMMHPKAVEELGRGNVSCLERPDMGVTVWGIKLMLDRTTGSLYPSQTELNEIVLEAQGRGWPVAIHAVEEETIQAALEALEAAIAHHPGNLKHRIEHGSVCPPHLVRRMAALGVTVTTQPSFLYYFGERYLRSVKPEQLPHLYPLGTWLRSGVHVAGSSDCPMVPPAPLAGICAAANRQAENGEIVSAGQPDQRLSVEDAIAMYTTSASRAAGLASVTGSLAPGKDADLVLLGRNPCNEPPEKIKEIEVRLTMARGKTVWPRDSG